LDVFLSDPPDFGAGFGLTAAALRIIFLAVRALEVAAGLLAAAPPAAGCGASLTTAIILAVGLVLPAMSFSF
jgi:hypothetical protein